MFQNKITIGAGLARRRSLFYFGTFTQYVSQRLDDVFADGTAFRDTELARGETGEE
jgi:hypothetical protein